jgi:uncharacterized membrane protein
MRTTAWVVMTVFALAIAAYALAVLAKPSLGAPFLQNRLATVPLALYAHLAGGGIAMALGPWQFNARLRARALRLHRWMGRGYLVAVLLSGAGALALAARSEQGLVTHAGFGLLAILWLATTAQAYRCIRRGDVDVHRMWMTRSYSLTLAAVTLRIYLPLALAAGVPFADAYQAVSWLCWVPNLVVAEWWFVPRAGAAPAGVRVLPSAPWR